MDDFNIENYLNSLDANVTTIDVSNQGITYLPSLIRFTSLTLLDCHNNQLTSLPELPNTLIELFCYNNKLVYLPKLPNTLLHLYCQNNKLNSLPELPNSLLEINCKCNNLNSLPKLPNNLQYLHCGNNNLISLPVLPLTIILIYYYNNFIYKCIDNNQSISYDESMLVYGNWGDLSIQLQHLIRNHKSIITNINTNNNILIKFRYLYYSLKFKKQFKYLLWEKIRKPKIIQKYRPECLLELLENNETNDLDVILNNW